MAIDIVMINNSSIMSDLVCSWSKSQLRSMLSIGSGQGDRLMNRNTAGHLMAAIATTLNIDGRLEPSLDTQSDC